jgi:hypothetical protein
METVDRIAGQQLDVRIEDGVMLITPADAGIALFAGVSQQQAREDEAWKVVEELAKKLDEVRDENAEIRDLFEDLHPMLVEFGQTELADRLMQTLYPVTFIREESNND